ncbi:hypothetical protein pb186bvf_019748 [Paramecium bursaria]
MSIYHQVYCQHQEQVEEIKIKQDIYYIYYLTQDCEINIFEILSFHQNYTNFFTSDLKITFFHNLIRKDGALFLLFKDRQSQILEEIKLNSPYFKVEIMQNGKQGNEMNLLDGNLFHSGALQLLSEGQGNIEFNKNRKNQNNDHAIYSRFFGSIQCLLRQNKLLNQMFLNSQL